ncbi:hypothetical protein MMC17_000449 [Xylographa soralifera]|nr:hypothetical protein [Xylographa soralifera]
MSAFEHGLETATFGSAEAGSVRDISASVLFASIMRIVSTSQELQYNEPYEGLVGSTWAIVETQVAIVFACLPILRPLVPRKGWLGRLRTQWGFYNTASPHVARPHPLVHSEALGALFTKPPATLPIVESSYLHSNPIKILESPTKEIDLRTNKTVK